MWDLSASVYPLINIEIEFSSGINQLSTPIFYGYNFGTELALPSDMNKHRRLDVSDGVFDYKYDTGYDMYLDSTSFFTGSVVEFQKPIYVVRVSGFMGCLVDIEMTYPGSNPFAPDILTNEQTMFISIPAYKFELSVSFYSDCSVDTFLVQLTFGHHLKGVGLDFGVDGVNEWEFNEPAFGSLDFKILFMPGKSMEQAKQLIPKRLS